jgi:probable HAF family extracellular repeat protein
VALIASCLTVVAGPRPRFELTDLGALPGAHPGGIANAINDRGEVVGSAANSNGLVRPFLYRNGTMTDPGSAAGWGEAVAINNAGQILTHESAGSEHRSFLIGTNGVIDLSAQAGQWVSAMSLNKAGVVVGVTSPGDNQYSAFMWSNGVFTVLGVPAGTLTSVATDINKRGVIAGKITVPPAPAYLNSERAVLFRNGDASVLRLPAGAVGSVAKAINFRGQIAGDAYYSPDADGQSRAFVFYGGKPLSIGTLHGDRISNASDINNAGQVVGISQDLVNEPRAFLYSFGVLYDLNDLVKHARGWHFRTANAINNRGQIVGEALVEGGSRPYLLTPDR